MRACGSILVALFKAVYSIRESEAGTVIDPREEVGVWLARSFFLASNTALTLSKRLAENPIGPWIHVMFTLQQIPNPVIAGSLLTQAYLFQKGID